MAVSDTETTPVNITDPAQNEVDDVLTSVEAKLHREYTKAEKEMREKLEAFMRQFKAEDEAKKELLESGEITLKEYGDWRQRKLLIGSRWEQMLEVLAADAVHTDMIAMSIVKGHMPEVYAIGHNYGTYLIESGIGIDTSYTLYDRHTVERLWRDNPKLLPDPAPNSKTARLLKEHKDLVWNKTHIQSAVTQGILQGESLSKVADRLQTVTDMDENAAKRNAGTMLTSAQNGGRLDSFKRAENMGIKCKKTWIATLDGRTRTSHRHVDGETVPNDEQFSNGCMFPGDPDAAPRELYNCRCTMITQIEGFERDPEDMGLRRDEAIMGMSYDEWKKGKEKGAKKK